MVIQARSSGFEGSNLAKITINNIPIRVERNENDHYRGLHIVVINPKNGKVEAGRVFDTYKTSEQLDSFILNCVPPRYIVVAACKDECVTNISLEAMKWFVGMGSQEIKKLAHRQGFAFIGVNGIVKANEKRASLPKEEVSVTQIFAVDDGQDFAAQKMAQKESSVNYLDSISEAISQHEVNEAITTNHVKRTHFIPSPTEDKDEDAANKP